MYSQLPGGCLLHWGRGLGWWMFDPTWRSCQPGERDCPTVPPLQEVAQLSSFCVAVLWTLGLQLRQQAAALALKTRPSSRQPVAAIGTREHPFMPRCETPCGCPSITRERLCLGWRGCDQLVGLGGCTQAVVSFISTVSPGVMQGISSSSHMVLYFTAIHESMCPFIGLFQLFTVLGAGDSVANELAAVREYQPTKGV